jgi:hypothetical protein
LPGFQLRGTRSRRVPPIVCTWSFRHSATERHIDPPEDDRPPLTDLTDRRRTTVKEHLSPEDGRLPLTGVSGPTDLTKVTIETSYTCTSLFDRQHCTTARSIQVLFRRVESKFNMPQ